jgi:hypothetical protein
MKPLALAIPLVLLLSSCAAYNAQHASAAPAKSRSASSSTDSAAPAAPARKVNVDKAVVDSFEAHPLDEKQALLISEIDKYRNELESNGQYDCCVKPACRQCALTAGECHCRLVISKNGPCCGECTQAWVEGRGDAPGVDREKVLEHLGCVRELYEKKTPDGVTPPAQSKDGSGNGAGTSDASGDASDATAAHQHHH